MKRKRRQPQRPPPRRKRGKYDHLHEPDFSESEEWVDFGCERIWAEGFTEGGAPYGCTEEALRASSYQVSPRAGWARARLAFETAAALALGQPATVGYVKHLGAGLARDAYIADIDLPGGRRDRWVALIPRADAEPDLAERTHREVRILAALRAGGFPLRLPEVIGGWEDDGPILVQRFLPGTELDLRAGRQERVRPWAIVGEAAAAVHAHRVDIPGHATRRAHALAAIAPLARLPGTAAAELHAWAMEHLPDDTPSTLLHGDLLGQNILLARDEPPGLLDFERATLGDPAHDLAIVTRGAARAFALADGLSRLLDAYAAAGGHPVTRAHVHIHEAGMLAGWCTEDHPDAAARLAGLGRRCLAGE